MSPLPPTRIGTRQRHPTGRDATGPDGTGRTGRGGGAAGAARESRERAPRAPGGARRIRPSCHLAVREGGRAAGYVKGGSRAKAVSPIFSSHSFPVNEP